MTISKNSVMVTVDEVSYRADVVCGYTVFGQDKLRVINIHKFFILQKECCLLCDIILSVSRNVIIPERLYFSTLQLTFGIL